MPDTNTTKSIMSMYGRAAKQRQSDYKAMQDAAKSATTYRKPTVAEKAKHGVHGDTEHHFPRAGA
jgi:hypothetical protein